MPKRTVIPRKPGAAPVKRTGVLKAEPHKVTKVPRKVAPAPAPAKAATPRATPPGKGFTDSGNKTVTIRHVSSGNRSVTTRRSSVPVFGGMLQGDSSTIIAGTVVATGLTVINQLLNDKLSMRPIIGGFIVGTGLLIMAFFNTPIASALTLLILVSSLLNNGMPILDKALKAAG